MHYLLFLLRSSYFSLFTVGVLLLVYMALGLKNSLIFVSTFWPCSHHCLKSCSKTEFLQIL